ncbi:MAG: PilZ domain-containing protein [Planctomycetes bacterium]|nr:PilZ domain-containing protein [Planctomycetota bacterium]
MTEAKSDFSEERRREKRLNYLWPIWFAQEQELNKNITQGQMVDVSSGGAAFTCHADENCPYPGQEILLKFSLPRYESNNEYYMASFSRQGYVKRVDQVDRFIKKVATQFATPLPFSPSLQNSTDIEIEKRSKSAVI